MLEYACDLEQISCAMIVRGLKSQRWLQSGTLSAAMQSRNQLLFAEHYPPNSFSAADSRGSTAGELLFAAYDPAQSQRSDRAQFLLHRRTTTGIL